MDSTYIKSFYDQRWTDFRYANRLKNIRAGAILQMLAETRITEPSILDVGCGAGWLSNILSMFGPTTGLELSGQAVKTAADRFPHVDFVEGDLLCWRAQRQFDVVVAQEVIEHFEDHTAFIEAVSAILKPGGYLILTTPNATTLAAMRPEQRRTFQQQPVENPLTRRQLISVMRRYFEVRRCHTLIPGFGEAPPFYRFMHSRRLCNTVDRIFGRGSAESISCRLGFGLHLVLLARKPE